MGGGWRYPTPTRPSPLPTQRRAADTIAAAIAATVELLEQLPVTQVTLEAVRLRSGISQGSLTHHFGNREALIATAQVERYARGCAADAAFIGRLEGSVSEPEPFARTMLGLLADMLTTERRTARWVRMAAVAAALGDAELTATIGHSYTALTDRTTALVERARTDGVLLPEVDPRTVALLLSMQAQGLVLDDLMAAEVPLSAWHRLQVRFIASFVTPPAVAELERQEQERFGDLWRAETFGAPGRVPADVTARLTMIRRHFPTGARVAVEDMVHRDGVEQLLIRAEGGWGPDEHRERLPASSARLRVVAQACAQLREGGERAIDVHAIRTAEGLRPQSLHRLVGGRDALLRAARVRVEIERAAGSIARFARYVAEAEDPATMRASLVAGGVRMASLEKRTAMWQRIETIEATRTDGDLRASLGRVQRAARDLLIEQVALAQARGSLDPRLPAGGIARFLDGTPFWHVFHGLDPHAPAHDTWVTMLEQVAGLLSPDR